MNEISKSQKEKYFSCILVSLCLFFSFVYFSSSRLIISANDGSQFALTSAIAFEKRFAIQGYAKYTRYWDYAYKDGNFYSDRPIGTSLISLPLFLLSNLYLEAGETNKSNDRPAKAAALLTVAIMGSCSVVLLILCLGNLGVSKTSSLVVGIAFGLSSLNWKYSAIFMSHCGSGLFLILCVFFLTKGKSLFTINNLPIFYFSVGMLPLMRYELVLLIPVLLFWAEKKRREFKPTITRNTIIISFCLGILPLAFLAMYQTICFGLPWQTFTPFYSPHFNYWKSYGSSKSGGGFTIPSMHTKNLFEGLKLIFFGWPSSSKAWGILILQPLLFLCPWGAIIFYKKNKVDAILIAIICAIIIISSAKNLSIAGGRMMDPRYVFPCLPLLFLTLGFLLDDLFKKCWGKISLIIFSFLTTLSGFICLFHFLESDGSAFIWSPKGEYSSKNSFLYLENISYLTSKLFCSISMGFLAPLTILTIILIFQIIKFLLPSERRVKELVNILTSCLLAITAIMLISIFILINQTINVFDDTLQVAGQPLKVAVQTRNFSYLNLPNSKSETLLLDGQNCLNGLVVSPRSSSILQSPHYDSVFKFRVGVADNHVSETTSLRVAIVLNDRPAKDWIFTGEKNHSANDYLNVPANSKIELISEYVIDQTTKSIVLWCDTEFTQIIQNDDPVE